MAKIAGQRLEHANLTRGNVADSHTPGNNTPETRLPGWGTWIRTKIDGVRIRSDRSRSWRPSPFNKLDPNDRKKASMPGQGKALQAPLRLAGPVASSKAFSPPLVSLSRS
jgi:hypothetical protein